MSQYIRIPCSVRRIMHCQGIDHWTVTLAYVRQTIIQFWIKYCRGLWFTFYLGTSCKKYASYVSQCIAVLLWKLPSQHGYQWNGNAVLTGWICYHHHYYISLFLYIYYCMRWWTHQEYGSNTQMVEIYRSFFCEIQIIAKGNIYPLKQFCGCWWPYTVSH